MTLYDPIKGYRGEGPYEESINTKYLILFSCDSIFLFVTCCFYPGLFFDFSTCNGCFFYCLLMFLFVCLFDFLHFLSFFLSFSLNLFTLRLLPKIRRVRQLKRRLRAHQLSEAKPYPAPATPSHTCHTRMSQDQLPLILTSRVAMPNQKRKKGPKYSELSHYVQEIKGLNKVRICKIDVKK